MAEYIISKLRPGFPKISGDGKAKKTELEYIGKEIDLSYGGGPTVGSYWGDYPGTVETAAFEPIELTDYGILRVVCEKKYDQGEAPGQLAESTYEIDWVDVQRSLYEHPQFVVGGGGGDHNLTDEDVIQLKAWENEPVLATKKDFKANPNGTGEVTLSENAKLLAKGLLKGIEYWVEKAPVLRITATYNNGPPPESNAGEKGAPTGFPNMPTGYEWVKSADRSVRGSKQNKWERVQEWLGAKKVFIDTNFIYWE